MERVPESSYDVSEPFVLFWGGYQSNWYRCEFEINGEKFNCTEQHMMAEKARLFEDWDTRKKIMRSRNPREQKKLGREVRGFKPALWNEKSLDIVIEGNREKYRQNPDLRVKLIAA